jgi:phthalate 4,5-dioxygenase oxygenase subunit
MAEMLDAEERWTTLTRTGPGTPAGRLLRRFWQPVVVSHELPPGAAPRPVRIMSEDMVLFRNDDGSVGLVDPRCAHRNVDLSYGRVEDGGIRCIYHGWLYGIDGRCLEQPNNPDGDETCSNIRIKSYPCIDRGGLIWTYMGEGEAPLLPDFPFLDAAPGHRYIWRWFSNCNYLQGVDGDVDPSHTSFLHGLNVEKVDEERRNRFTLHSVDKAPRLTVKETSFGLRVLTERMVPAEQAKYLRVSNWILPNGSAANGHETYLGLGGCSTHWHVPIDDTHHMRFEIVYHAKKPLPIEAIDKIRAGEQTVFGQPRRTPENRYQQSREEMATTFAGLGVAFPIHDIVATEAQGPINDHRTEHLIASDVAIARMRRDLLAAIQASERGEEPKSIIRDPASRHLADFVVFSEKLDENADAAAFADEIATRNIYARG